MQNNQRLSIALQKKGRLNKDSLELLTLCGIKFRNEANALLIKSENLAIDLLFVRDDDIPTLIKDGSCDLGIVGENVWAEEYNNPNDSQTLQKLGFGSCRLSIAIPENDSFNTIESLQNKRIATSYPNLLKQYLDKNEINASILTISGSVEIAPRLQMADAICDLASSGRTLEENNLIEVQTILNSQAILVQKQQPMDQSKQALINLLLTRIRAVIKARDSKYIMFHAPINSLEKIKQILPGVEQPTVLPLNGSSDKVAIHVVSPETLFWQTLEKLKQAGASSLVVLPIEKMME